MIDKKMDAAKVKMVLVIKLCCIGDIIQLTPALRALKAGGNEVHLICVKWVKEIAQMVPFVDKIHTVDMKNLVSMADIVLKLRAEKYDLVINYHRDLKSYMFMAAIGAKYKAGFDWDMGKNFLDSSFVFDSKLHETQRYLSITRGLKIPDSGLYTELKAPDKTGLSHKLVEDKIKVGIFPAGGNNPGTVMASKRWPAANFNELIKRFEKAGIAVYVFGAGFDAAVMNEAIKGTAAYSIISGLTEMAFYVSKLDLFIACDTGPLHLAAALGIKTIGLYGPSSPEVFGAMGRNSLNIWEKITCAPCYEPATVLKREFLKCGDNVCMKKITVEKVFNAAQDMLKKSIA
jgi:heptosyltransferase-2/heptosyltransferase-3